MILLGDTLISEDIFQKNFICDLNACKGACCIEGDLGAPVEPEEIEAIRKDFDAIKPYLSNAAKTYIEAHDFCEEDGDEWVTNCLPTGECVFVTRDERGWLQCGIEQAYLDGETTFKKPISCHLYPIRLSKVGSYDALNYHRWVICNPACVLGDTHKVPVYSFLKEALIRRFGQTWYDDLVQVKAEFDKQQ